MKHLTRRELRRMLINPAMRDQPALRLFARRHGHSDLLEHLLGGADPATPGAPPALAPSWPQIVTANELTISNIGETMVLTHVHDDDGEHRIEYAGGRYAEVWIYGDCVYEVPVRRPGGLEPDIDFICAAVRAYTQAAAASEAAPPDPSTPRQPGESAGEKN